MHGAFIGYDTNGVSYSFRLDDGSYCEKAYVKQQAPIHPDPPRIQGAPINDDQNHVDKDGRNDRDHFSFGIDADFISKNEQSAIDLRSFGEDD